MRSDRCGECGDEFTWDSDAGSAVCVACGTLQDPSQVVLDSHIDAVDSTKDYSHTFKTRTTLKSFRNSNGWDLAGQGNTPALERNKNAISHFAAGLARRIGHPGLHPRAQLLFEQAVEKGDVRWGRQARLTAGAALAIALREAHKGETIKDIAFLLEESPVSLARAFTRLVRGLGIQLTSSDPSWLLPTLRNRMVEILGEHPTSALPRNLVKVLKPLHLPNVLRTATALSELVSRAGLVVHLPSPPTACAIFILALEGHAMASLPNVEQFAKFLGSRFGVSGDVIMRRYKIISDQVQTWSQNIPWLQETSRGNSDKKRAKMSRRTEVSRVLKDAVQFQDSVWKGKLEKLRVASDGDEEELSESDIGSNPVQLGGAALTVRPARKRRKLRHMDDISHFLLSPLDSQHSLRGSKSPAVPSLDAVAHILSSETLSLKVAPTRLQLLATVKNPDDITDDELFDEGEFENLMRNEEERDALLRTCDWAREGSEEAENEEEAHTAEARRRDRTTGGTSRINIEALNRLLEETEAQGTREACYDEDADWSMTAFMDPNAFPMTYDDQAGGYCRDDGSIAVPVTHVSNDDDEELEPWRPLSPKFDTCWDDDADD